MKRLVTIICLILTLVSCQDLLENPNAGEQLIAIYYDELKFYQYEYSTEGDLMAERGKFHYHGYIFDEAKRQVKKEVFLDNRLLSSSSSIVQQAMERADWVSPENTPLAGTLVFEFDNDNRLVKSTELSGYSEYEFGQDNKISVVRMYSEGQLKGTREYSYDNFGNVSVDKHFIIAEDGSKFLASITEYDYDDKKNPFFNLRPDRFPVENLNPNNIIRKIYTLPDVPNGGSDISYSYTYNELGLPTSRSDGMRFEYR